MNSEIATPSSSSSTTMAAPKVMIRKLESANFNRPSATERSRGSDLAWSTVSNAEAVMARPAKLSRNKPRTRSGADGAGGSAAGPGIDYFCTMSLAQAFLTRAITLSGIGM